MFCPSSFIAIVFTAVLSRNEKQLVQANEYSNLEDFKFIHSFTVVNHIFIIWKKKPFRLNDRIKLIPIPLMLQKSQQIGN